MNKTLPLLAVILIAFCAETVAQNGRNKSNESSRQKVVETNKGNTSEGKHASKSVSEGKESNDTDAIKLHEDGVTNIIKGSSGALSQIASKLELTSIGAYSEPIVIVPHLNDGMDTKFWNGLVSYVAESQIPIRNIVIKEAGKTDNAIAIAVNSLEGIQYLEKTKLFSRIYSVIGGYDNLFRAKEQNVLKAKQKYSLFKVVKESNVNFLPGEYGPMKVNIESDGTIKQ